MINTVIFRFRRNLIVLRLGMKTSEIWGFCPYLYQGHFITEVDRAKLLLEQTPQHVRKFRECWQMDGTESALGKRNTW